MRLAYEREIAIVRAVLEAAGSPAEPAEVQARWLAEADLRGHRSHGLQRLPVIARRIERGLIRPGAAPALRWTSAAAAVVDGGRGLGPWVGTRTADAVVERAARTGIAMAAIHNANHLGLLAPYVEAIAGRGLIGLVLTTTEALVHPWNGSAAMVGTNPIAVGVPTAAEPFVLDMATSAVSMGKLLDHRHRDVALEPGWAVDAQGRPTTDPHAARALAPFGGPKGYGLALAFELIVASATGAALGRDITGTLDAETVCNKGDLIVAVDPAALEQEHAPAATAAHLAAMRAMPRAPGTVGVSVPGDGARTRRARSLREGIEVADAVWAEVAELPGIEAVIT